MTWWRDLGKGWGYQGTFSIHRVECAYCGNHGAFTRVFEQLRKLQTWNVLHYEAYQCNECSNVTFIIWAGEEGKIGGRGLHNFRQFPSPTRLEAPDYWPEGVASAYLQAEKSLQSESWDAAATMARRAVQATIRHMAGTGKGNLVEEIKELVRKQELPRTMGEWADEVRELGNVGAHPNQSEKRVSQQDAKDVVRFAQYFILYAIDVPHQIDEYKKSRKKDNP